MNTKSALYVLVADYGCDGLRLHGVFSTDEKAKAAGFDANLYGHGRVIECQLDELLAEKVTYGT